MVRIETDVDLLDKESSRLERAITTGKICECLKDGKRVLLFHRHTHLSHMYIYPRYCTDGDIIPFFQYVYWDLSNGAEDQPPEYKESHVLEPEDLKHLSLAILIPVSDFDEAKEKVRENMEEYKKMIYKYKMMDSLCK